MEFIVTGANSGIGFEIAKGLLEQPGCHVIMACRDMKTGKAKQAELQACSTTRGTCEACKLDLEDLNSVKSFALEQRARLKKQGKTLNVLVNNAGVLGVPNTFGTDEDRHFTINHVGPFLLTKLLLPSMTKGSRVVTVASQAHRFGSMHFDAQGKLDQHPKYWLIQYGRSKLANILFTSELQKREGASRGITCYSMDPGAVKTSIFTGTPFDLLLKLPFIDYFLRTPKKGAKTAGYAALSPDLEGKHVLFLLDEKENVPSALARDPVMAEKLWDYTETLVAPYVC